MTKNPFNARAAEQMGGDIEIIECESLEFVKRDSEEYQYRKASLIARGKMIEQTEEDKQIIIEGSWRRAAGLCICEICGKTYQEHPYLYQYAILNKLCDGRLVKL
jgi:hypothetical protein